MVYSPKELTVKMKDAAEAYEAKAYNDAVTILNDIIKHNDTYAPAYRELGKILTHSRFQKKAEEHLNKAIALMPEDPENWKAMGYLYKKTKEYAKCLGAFKKALNFIDTESEEGREIYTGMLEAYDVLGDSRSAFEISKILLKNDPDKILYQYWHARLIAATGKKTEALELYAQLLLDENHIDLPSEFLEEWLDLMIDLKQVKEARAKLENWMEKDPDNVQLRNLYAKSCQSDGDELSALRVAEETYHRYPDDVRVNSLLINLYSIFNEREKVNFHYKKALEINPDILVPLDRLIGKYKIQYGDEIFRHLNKLAVHMAEFSKEHRVALHYNLGRAYDDAGDPATAFEHYRLGGTLHSQGLQNIEYRSLDERLYQLRALPKNYFKPSHPTGCTSSKPVFILGMPRSGTTLMEQVLSGLGNVHGAGELGYIDEVLRGMDVNGQPFFQQENTQKEKALSYKERGQKYIEKTEALAPKESRRIVDKMPHNFMHTGFIHLMLPNASIIHARRHPVETCLSAYRIHFAEGHYWADDLRTMGRYYRLYTELMAYWKSVLPQGTVLDVRYEDMVGNLEGESKRIAAHIGVEWSEACLDFHKSKKAVRTASLSQVRQPLYKSSMNRWRKYEPYLKPLLDEIGDLVEAYEKELDI
ncbi:tetratricopeptide repeat-containing sulfotransferase family protein [Sulfurovum sp. NBC37-1]|uniref:tetratricopeptide repeat-containing sulfotransferase family protein n=1 Tax=Sulfurovum sp. (strain NBC37-1) TaxID=387093 RepID=UPI000158770D|nr:tetratricopeptide repeat-containing sulfotransferase family protein [Sulfurovum sp. NBC37-1]BAF71297.1 conserved hypothetical protein [Sulfurovum sp. NBC37-1]